MALYRNRNQSKMKMTLIIAIVILIAGLIIAAIVTIQKIMPKEDEAQQIQDETQVNEMNQEEEDTTLYTAVFKTAKSNVTDVQIENVKKIIEERISNFGMKGSVHVSDGKIGIEVYATKKQEDYLKYLGTVGEIDMRVEDGVYIFRRSDVKSVEVKSFFMENEDVDALSITVDDSYIEKLKDITTNETGKTFAFSLDDALLLSSKLGNVIESGKIVISGIDAQYLKAVQVLCMSDPLPISLAVESADSTE